MARILVFGFDIAEAAQIRRIRGLIAEGHEVRSAAMRRDNMNRGFVPDWPNLHLFATGNGGMLRRFLLVIGAIVKCWAARGALGRPEVMLARNLDMLAVALGARLALPGRPPVIYECLDIHGSVSRPGLLGAMMRWAERRCLARTALLVVSSPRFVEAHFGPVQGYRGRWMLIENKLWAAGPLPRPARARPRPEGAPLTLGWVGAIRCAPSLDLLMAAADAMGPRLQVLIAGTLHAHAVPGLRAAIARRPNVTHVGPYAYPGDLGAVYGACDLVWAQDLWQAGANSDWLLPNRIYEAGYFGCPSLALAGTETGRRVAADGLGFTIESATPAALIACLAGLSPARVAAVSAGLLARDASAFRMSGRELSAMIAAASRPERGRPRPAAPGLTVRGRR